MVRLGLDTHIIAVVLDIWFNDPFNALTGGIQSGISAWSIKQILSYYPNIEDAVKIEVQTEGIGIQQNSQEAIYWTTSRVLIRLAD